MNSSAPLPLIDLLGGGHLVVQYQPIVDARSGATRAVETLARWSAAEGQLETADWLRARIGGDPRPQQEVDRTVLRQVLEERVSFPTLGATKISISQGVHSVSIEAIRAFVDSCAGRDGVPFAIEIFEQLSTAQLEAMPAFAEELADAGIEVWHDDFGTGERTLPHLIALPSTVVKLCPELVAGGATSARIRRHARSVIAMLHNLGKTVVAEGVRDTETADWVTDAGADWLQGGLYAKPMVALEAAAWLDAQEQHAA